MFRRTRGRLVVAALLAAGGVLAATNPSGASGAPYAVAVSAGVSDSCAVMSNTTVECWGDDTYGQLGDGVTATNSASPVAVSGITNAAQVATGDGTSCAVLTTRTVDCWGQGTSGQLGNGATSDSSTPVGVTGISNAVQITVGGQSACALLLNGSIACWGLNNDGQLGDGSTSSTSTRGRCGRRGCR